MQQGYSLINNQKNTKLKKFKIVNYINSFFQLVILGLLLYLYFNLDWETEIANNIKLIFPDKEEKNHKEVRALTVFSLRYGLKSSFFIIVGLIIWKFVYNFKFLKFQNNDVNWYNNFYFYIFYSLTSPIYCTLLNKFPSEIPIFNNNNLFYEYSFYLEIFAAYIMVFAILLSLLIIVWYFMINVIGSRSEVGRQYSGNTVTIYYENNENDYGCGCNYVKKIFGCSYNLLTIYGLLMLIFLIVGVSNYLLKTFVIIEMLINIYLYIVIRDLKILEKNIQRKIINDSNDQNTI